MTLFWIMFAWGCVGALALAVAAVYIMFDKLDAEDEINFNGRDFFSQQAMAQERWDFLSKKREEEK